MKTRIQIILLLVVMRFMATILAQEMLIPDPGLNAVIRETLAKPAGPLTVQDFVVLTKLNALRRNISSLEGLGAAHNLVELDLGGNQFTNLTLPLGLTNLTTLNLQDNPLTSLTLPADLMNLVELDLEGNPLLKTLVLSEQMEFTTLANTVSELEEQGTSVYAYGISTEIAPADPLDTWTSIPAQMDYVKGIAYGNGHFVAVGLSFGPGDGSTVGAILTSTDGVNWLRRQPTGLDENFYYSGICFGNGQFVIAGNGSAISSDGVTWIQGQGDEDYSLQGVTFANGQFVAVGGPGEIIVTSTDGVNWSTRHSEGWPNNLNAVAYGNGQFVAAGGLYGSDNLISNDSPAATILTSTDGANWVLQSLPLLTVNWWAHHTFTGIAYGHGLFIAVEYRGGVLSSTDGTNWVQNQLWKADSIIYENGQFVAARGRGIFTSTDGANWIRHLPGTNDSLNIMTYGNDRFVGVGSDPVLGTQKIVASGSIIGLSLTANSSNGWLALSLEGPIGLAYTVESSTNLTSWQTLTNFTSTRSTSSVFNASPAGPGPLFYRAFIAKDPTN